MNKPQPWPYPRLFAHRGGGLFAPENTLAALRTGAAWGYRGVEFDVKLSADDVPILLHDDTLERTTNGRGAVAQTAYRDIATLDAGGWYSAAFAGEPVPSFAAAAQLCRELGLVPNIEIKPCPGREVQTGTLVAALAQQMWAEQSVKPLLSSFSEAALDAARNAAPALPRGLLVEQIPDDWEQRLRALGGTSFHCNQRGLTAAQVTAIKQTGFPLLVYTVNDPARATELLAWGVDGLFTDALDVMAKSFFA